MSDMILSEDNTDKLHFCECGAPFTIDEGEECDACHKIKCLDCMDKEANFGALLLCLSCAEDE